MFFKKKIAVLGSGRIGNFIIDKLSDKYKVYAYDYDENIINKKNVIKKGLYDIKKLDINYDIVINALPSKIGMKASLDLISKKFNVIDISFYEFDRNFFVKPDTIFIRDFGFAPGLSHLLVAIDNNELDEHNNCIVQVGGLPINPNDEYKSTFCPDDIIQEYIRPARVIRNGKIETEIPFENIYNCLSYENIRLGGFISDGLRSLVGKYKTRIKNLEEYTLRSKSHCLEMKILKKYDQLDSEYIHRIMKKMWHSDWFEDIGILYVESKGKKNNKDVILRRSISCKSDKKYMAMAKLTGLPVVFAAEQILKNKIKPGFYNPEDLADNKEFFLSLFDFLKKNGVKISSGG